MDEFMPELDKLVLKKWAINDDKAFSLMTWLVVDVDEDFGHTLDWLLVAKYWIL